MINTKIIGHTLSHNLAKPSPTKRMPITNQIKINEDIKHTTIPKQQSNRTSTTSAVLASDNKTGLTSESTSETDKHGVIYNTESMTSLTSEHDDVKTLLIVSGVIAGLGYMYFYR